MKKITIVLAVVLFFAACKKFSNELPVTTKQGAEKVLNDNYPDPFPEWGVYGTNWPSPTISGTYSPRPDMYVAVRIAHDGVVVPPGSGFIPSPYVHIQWRKLLPNGEPGSQWYNYHPEIRKYQQLRIDTLPDWHPDLIYWEYNLNAKALPQGDLELRTRLLFLPLLAQERGSATLWSTNYSYVNNYFGYPDDGSDPGDGQMVTVNISVDLDVSMNNYSGKKIDHYIINAFGKSFLGDSALYGSHRGEATMQVRLNEPTPYSYSATVTAYTSRDNSTAIKTETQTFTHTIWVGTNTGSNPYFNFRDYFTMDIY